MIISKLLYGVFHLLPSIFLSHHSGRDFTPCMGGWPSCFASATHFFHVCSPSTVAWWIHCFLSYIVNTFHCLLFLFLPFNNETYLNLSQLNNFFFLTALSSFLPSQQAKFLKEWSTLTVSTPPAIVSKPNLGPLAHAQLRQSIDTRLWWRKVQCLLQGAKTGEQAAYAQKTWTPQWFSGKGF